MSTRRSRWSFALVPLFLAVPIRFTGLPARSQDADEQYRFLAGLVEKGLYDMAVEEAQTFLRDHPEHAKAELARYRLACALWELGRRDEAAREYQTLARSKSFEYRAECLFRSGECALGRGDHERARAAFEAVLRADQGYLHAPALFFLGETAFAARDFALAEQRYQELLRAHSDAEQAPLARRALAWCAWERGDPAETVRRVRAALEGHPDAPQADELRGLAGEALLALKRPKEALESFRAMSSGELGDARSRGAGFALAALGDHAGAAREFEGLLEAFPQSRYAEEARLQAGIALLQANDARRAAVRLTEAASGGDPEALFWLAQAQKDSGDGRGALASLERALRGKPAQELEERIQVLRGDLLAGAGRSQDALEAYEKGGSDYALYAGSVAALNQGDSAGAIRLAEKLLRERPQSPQANAARLVLGEALFAAQNYEAAERAFGESLEHASAPAETARARLRLGWCRYLSGDLPGAARRFQELGEAREDASEVEEGLAMLARVQLEAGDLEPARKAAERYRQRYPSGRFGDQVLHALARASSGEAARRAYRELLERHPQSALRPTALLELGDLESAAGEHESAEGRYGEILQQHGNSSEAPRARYGLAWSRFQRGDFDGCAKLLETLERDENIVPELREAALELLVWAHERRAAPEQSAAAWRRFAALASDQGRCFEAARTVLSAYRAAGRAGGGRTILEECLPRLTDPSLAAAAQIESAYLALDGQDLERAEQALATARSRAPRDARVAEAAFHVGEARFAQGDLARALQHYEGALAAENPRCADALYKTGFVRLQNGDLEAAQGVLRSFLERFPHSALAPEARFLLGETLFRAQRYEEAAAELARVRREARDELLSKALFRLGLALGHLERWSDCEGALSELASRHGQFPNLAEAELWRGRALAAQQKGRAARAAFERTIALDQGELAAAARLALGGLLEAEGRLEDALSEYLKVALLYAHEDSVAEALYRAGRALENLGDVPRALERYRELQGEHARSRFAELARARLRELEQR